ncbi:MAG: hypothetical protein E6G08_00395 [Actinobacteria bacterium]|nr:MAG: hypothetical protein E6G08_00395 [Actinomycetota bacterium]
MSFFQRVVAAPRTLLGAQAQPAQAAVPVTAQPSTVFVELGSVSQQANIARNGVQVPVVTLNPAVLENVLGQTTRLVPKVVSQSIQAGVSVAKGTTIDLVLAQPASLKVKVLQNAFVPLAEETLDTVFKNVVRDNPQVQSVLARNISATSLSTADQATLTTALTQGGTAVTTDPGHTIDAAFNTLQAAFTFGT